jgi:hypothetical protein
MLRKEIDRLTILLFATLAIGLLTAAPVRAQAQTFTDNVKEPIALAVFVECANGGAGELVELTGTLHVLFHVTVDAQGGVHVKSHFQPQGIRGVGSTTGDKYQATGVTQDHFNAGSDGLPVTFTFINNFRIIGKGPGNNFLVHETFHVTINANGQVTAEVDNFRAECK